MNTNITQVIEDLTKPTKGKFRSWCFTLNNYTEDEWNHLPKMFEDKSNNINYLVQGKEVGDNGTPHIQGFIHFDSQRSLGGLKKIHSRAHWEAKSPKSTFEEAANYCKKEKNFIELGKLPKQGARTDILDLKTAATEGLKKHQLYEQFGESYLKYHKAIDAITADYRRDARIKKGYLNLEVIIHWGHTGTGKTKEANADPENTYMAKHTPTGYWYDGYVDQRILILDEFGCNMPLNDLKDRLDGHCNIMIPVKGGMTPQSWDTVHITSNQDPRTWYSNCRDEDRKALWNRITKVIKYNEDKTKVVELDKPYRSDPEDWAEWLGQPSAFAEDFVKHKSNKVC